MHVGVQCIRDSPPEPTRSTWVQTRNRYYFRRASGTALQPYLIFNLTPVHLPFSITQSLQTSTLLTLEPCNKPKTMDPNVQNLSKLPIRGCDLFLLVSREELLTLKLPLSFGRAANHHKLYPQEKWDINSPLPPDEQMTGIFDHFIKLPIAERQVHYP